MNIQKALNIAESILHHENIKSSKLDSEVLMTKVINKCREYVLLNPRQEIKKSSYLYFQKLVNQRLKGKPIAQLLGKKDFWNLEFEINKNVLIPRPDTELLVSEVLKLIRHKNKVKILDIGTGSGCILISILNERIDCKGVGIDISKKCIDLSKINAKKFNIINRVNFFKSDVDNFNYGKYDLVISNPPYIKLIDIKKLDKDVVDFEPKLAINGGIDGLTEVKKVINKSSKILKVSGKLVLEIGFDQKDKVKRLLIKKGFYINKTLKDYGENYRCIISTKI